MKKMVFKSGESQISIHKTIRRMNATIIRMIPKRVLNEFGHIDDCFIVYYIEDKHARQE